MNTLVATLLAPLAFIPNDAFQRHVRDYVICHVFTEMEQLEQEMSVDEEVYNEEKSIAFAKAINDRRVALAGYLKLIVFNVFDMPLAAPVLSHYVKVCVLYQWSKGVMCPCTHSILIILVMLLNTL